MIFITSTGELLLYFIVIFLFHIKKIKIKILQDSFCVVFVWPYFNCKIAFSSGFN